MSEWKLPENIQIPKQLFFDLVQIVCNESADDEIWQRAQKGLEEKISKLADRQRYSAARTEAPGEEKQKLWQAYVDGKK